MTGKDTLRDRLSQAEQIGRRAGAAYAKEPSQVPDEEFGDFSNNAGFRTVWLRRVLAGLGVPPAWLIPGRLLLADRGRVAKFEAVLRRYAYWRGVRRGLGSGGDDWNRVQRGPVILMYHAIGRTAAEAGSCYVVPERRFRRQMAWLRWRGYTVLGLRDLIAHLDRHALPPARSVAITFDDGYADNCELALPVLRRYGFPATVFVVSEAIGGTATWTSDRSLTGRAMLSPAQLLELSASGVEVGAHTRTHPPLTQLSGDEQQSELSGSREALEQLVGRPVLTFAYPFGDYDAAVAVRVAQAGFSGACCSRAGVNDLSTPRFELRRLEVRGTDSLMSFALMLWRAHRPRRVQRSTERATA